MTIAFGARLAGAARAVEEWIPAPLLELLFVAALLAWVGWVYWPLALGIAPTTNDHGFVLYRAVELENLLGRGELFGWSDLQFGGHPPAVNYPVAGAVLTAALDALPGVPLETAYAWSILLCLAAMALSLYFAGRLHFTRWTGLVAGALVTLDPGGWWIGGHESALYVGMWIQTFSTAFLIAGLALWARALRSRGRREVFGSGALLGLAVLFHPQAALLAIPAGVLMLVALLLTSGRDLAPALGRTALVAATALAVAAFWLVPFAANWEYSSEPTWPPLTREELWRARFPSLWMAASGFGIGLLALRRDVFSRFVALAVPAFVVLFARESLEALRLWNPASPGVADVLQLARVQYLVRPLATFAAAYAVAAALPRALSSLGAERRNWRVVAALAASTAIAVSVARSIDGPTLPALPPNPCPRTFSSADEAHLERALDAAAALLQPGERIALRTVNPYDHALVFAPARRRQKVLKIGRDAASPFVNRIASADPEVLSRVGATAVVALGQNPGPLESSPPIGGFGPFVVRRLLRAPRAWMDGPGRVEILEWTEERIRLRVTGSVPDGHVRLGMGAYEGWRTPGGQAVTMIRLNGAPFAALPARDGEVVLEYRGPRSRWVGYGLTLLGGAALAVYLRRARRRAA